MAKAARSKSANLLVYVLLGLLVVGLAGFGVGSFGGNLRAIGKVGNTEIPVDTYYRALQQELSAFAAQTGAASLPMADAQAIGLDRNVLSTVVALTALDDEAARLGLSVDDAAVLDEIRGVEAFANMSGAFDEETYRFVLEQNGLNPSEFEEQTRRELARALLNASVSGGVSASATYSDTLMNFIGERRSFEWARLAPAALAAPLEAATVDDLRGYYDAHPGLFTQPEQRRVDYIWLTPDMLIPAITPDEAALRAAYDARLSEFKRPEARLVERLVFATAEEASTARAELDAGRASFDDLVEARGLTLSDVDLGDVTADDLAPAAAEAVFALDEPGIAGPLDSALGPALYRLNGILSAQDTGFDEVRALLADDIVRDTARRQISDMVGDIDDLLAGGATLAEIAEETEMQGGTLVLPRQDDAPISAYGEFRAAVNSAEPGAYAEVAELSDGGIYAFELTEIIDPALDPFETVRDRVETLWQIDATRAALVSQAEGYVPQLREGVQFSALGLDALAETGLTRDRFVPDAPPALLSRAFEMTPGEVGLVEGADDVYLVRLTAIEGPVGSDPDMITIRDALDQQYSTGVAADILDLFAQARAARAGIDLNQAAINAVHAQIP